MVRNERGQATMEYILLLAVVVSFFMVVSAALKKTQLGASLMRPLQEDFARTYQYGHPKAKGFDDGGPENHPRAVEGDGNFRIFIRKGKG